ncbi:MAG: hypothetical protein ACLGHX_08820 [Acidimicrobiia bacterium]
MFREPMSELAAQLRQSTGAEMIEEWEVTELETEQGRLRSRLLSDVWEQAMHRGDQVTASGAFGTCTGTVDYVGKDYSVVRSADTVWDVRLAAVTVSVRQSSHGGHTVRGGSRTLRARLAEYEASGEAVVVHLTHTTVQGVVRVSATDHVRLASDREVVVPLETIHAISRSV